MRISGDAMVRRCVVCLWVLAMLAMGARAETVDTVGIVESLRKSKLFIRKHDKDSASVYMNKAFRLMPADKGKLSYSMLLKVAQYLEDENNYMGALEYYLQALKVLDNPRSKSDVNTKKNYVSLYRSIAFCLHHNSPNRSLEYLKKCLAVAESIHKEDDSYDVREVKMEVFNNMGALYTDMQNTDSAELYYRKAFAFRNPADRHAAGTLYNNLGIIRAKKGDLKGAIALFNKSLEFNKEKPDTNTIANVYMNLGHCAYLQKDYPKAVDFFEKAIAFSRSVPNLRNELYSEDAISKTFSKMGDKERAFTHLKIAYSLKDSLLGIEKTRSGIDMELQYQYQKLKEELRFEQEMEVRKRSYHMGVFVLSMIILLSLVVVFYYRYRMQRNKNRAIRLEQESLALRNENLELRNRTLNDKLEMKQKELNTHAQYLLKRNDFVQSVIEKINAAKQSDDPVLNQTIRRIRGDMQESVGNELQALFQDLHKDFFTHLYEKHPDLTSNEKRLCSFIHLNMSSKDISSITGQSVKSIEIARSRLRAKLNLKREDNLNAYLQQF